MTLLTKAHLGFGHCNRISCINCVGADRPNQRRSAARRTYQDSLCHRLWRWALHCLYLRQKYLLFFVGGSDTVCTATRSLINPDTVLNIAHQTVAALGAFLLAMLMYPEVQARAHRELDEVLSPGDLPTFSDEPTLPYIAAIIREVVRYQPVTPLDTINLSASLASLPHRAQAQ